MLMAHELLLKVLTVALLVGQPEHVFKDLDSLTAKLHLFVVHPMEDKVVAGLVFATLRHGPGHGRHQGDVCQGVDGGSQVEVEAGRNPGALEAVIVKLVDAVGRGQGGDGVGLGLRDRGGGGRRRAGQRPAQLPGGEALPDVAKPLYELGLVTVGAELGVLRGCGVKVAHADYPVIWENLQKQIKIMLMLTFIGLLQFSIFFSVSSFQKK